MKERRKQKKANKKVMVKPQWYGTELNLRFSWGSLYHDYLNSSQYKRENVY